MTRHHILVDACVAAAYFAPATTRSPKLVSRAATLFRGSSTSFEHRLLIPTFCIAETFSVLEKYRWGASWNPHLASGLRLTPRKFAAARGALRIALHNGAQLLQVDLNRYHILAVDLIAPVNHAYKIQRNRTKKKNVNPASTYDMLIVAMGIWLQHQIGSDAFTIVTGERRLTHVVARAKSLKLAKPIRTHLTTVAQDLGLSYSPTLYPTVINLTAAKPSALAARFPNWSLPW